MFSLIQSREEEYINGNIFTKLQQKKKKKKNERQKKLKALLKWSVGISWTATLSSLIDP
jgi:hypothetical protein